MSTCSAKATNRPSSRAASALLILPLLLAAPACAPGSAGAGPALPASPLPASVSAADPAPLPRVGRILQVDAAGGLVTARLAELAPPLTPGLTCLSPAPDGTPAARLRFTGYTHGRYAAFTLLSGRPLPGALLLLEPNPSQ